MESSRITRVRPIPGLGTGRYNEPLDATVTNDTITTIKSTRGVGDDDFDADGASLMSGLRDNHTHFSLAALISQCTHFFHKATKSEIFAAIEDHLQHRPPRLVGYGFHSAMWSTPPTTTDLDMITTIPVALMPCDLHSFWYNTPALEWAGATGHPTGFLVEEEAFADIRRITPRYLDLVEHAIRTAELEAASRGLVGIMDFSSDWAVRAWQQHAASRFIGLQVKIATYPEWLDDLIAMGVGTGNELVENLRVGPLKIVADGSMGSHAAHYIAPYPNPLPGYPNGKPSHTRPELLVLLGRTREARSQIAVHVIDDAARHDILDAFEISGMCRSVEYIQCVAPAGLPWLTRLELVANTQPAHQLEDIEVVERVWPSAKDRTYPMFDLLRAGARLVFGFDVPMASLDPWKAIEAAYYRPYRTDQAFAPLATLWVNTRIMLSVGQPADLVLATSPGKVLPTMLGDRITFSR